MPSRFFWDLWARKGMGIGHLMVLRLWGWLVELFRSKWEITDCTPFGFVAYSAYFLYHNFNIGITTVLKVLKELSLPSVYPIKNYVCSYWISKDYQLGQQWLQPYSYFIKTTNCFKLYHLYQLLFLFSFITPCSLSSILTNYIQN